MQVIFNTISSIQPKKVVIPTLLMAGAAVSLAGGQIALASVFAVSAVGFMAATKLNLGMIDCALDAIQNEWRTRLRLPWVKVPKPLDDKETSSDPESNEFYEKQGMTAKQLPGGGVEIVISDRHWLGHSQPNPSK